MYLRPKDSIDWRYKDSTLTVLFVRGPYILNQLLIVKIALYCAPRRLLYKNRSDLGICHNISTPMALFMLCLYILGQNCFHLIFYQTHTSPNMFYI